MNSHRHVAVAFVCLLAFAAPALAYVSGSPDLSATLPDDTVAPGAEANLTVQVMNSATLSRSSGSPAAEQRVTTARGVRVRMAPGDAPVEVETGPIALGSIADGAVRTADFRVSVARDADPGTYRVPVHVSYEYTSAVYERSGVRYQESVTETLYVTLRVADEPRFRVLDVDSDVPVGDNGTVELTMRNVGSAPATDARVTVRSSGELTVGSGGTVTRFVGDWPSGESRTVEVAATALPSAEPREYAVATSVTYENEDGATATSDARSVGVAPLPEQQFAVGNVSGDLRVGEEGTLTATVTNRGPHPARDAVVRISATEDAVHPQRTEYALGDLGEGESATVSFPVSVSDAGEAGPHQFEFTVVYRNGEGEKRRSDPLAVRASVGAERAQFVVEAVNDALTAGGGGTVAVRVTNNGDEPVRNVHAKAFVDDPLSASDGEAFVPRLAPGESATVEFRLDVAGSAMAKTYPLSMDFQYETAAGEQKLSETYQAPVEVTAAAGGGLPVVPAVAGVAVLTLAAGGYAYYRRR